MRNRLALIVIAAIVFVFGIESTLAAPAREASGSPNFQTGATATATAGTATTPAATDTATATATAAPTSTATVAPTPTLAPSPTAVPPAVLVTASVVPSGPGLSGSFTVTWSSKTPGNGRVRFGSGPGCTGLIEEATMDRHAGTTVHAVIVTGNELEQWAVGDNGIQPGATYWFEVVTVTPAGEEIDNNAGQCYSITIPATVAASTTQTLTATLSGRNETPAGSPTGTGSAVVTFNTATNQVCWTLSVSGITLPATASHIHRGAAGVAGPVVIPLTAPGANGTAHGCATADAALIADIVAHPANYYVNVHTVEFPAGAIRGQLGSP